MKILSKETIIKFSVILGSVLVVIIAITLANHLYFSFQSRARKGLESCQKFSGTTLNVYSGNQSTAIIVDHPYCKVNILGQATLINTFDTNSLRTVKPGDLIVRVINLADYFKVGNPLTMEMDAEVANNPKIMSAIMNSDIGGNGKVFKLKKPTGYVSICGEVKIPGLNETNFVVTPSDNIERAFSTNQVSFCSKVLNTEQMPFLGIAFKVPEEGNMNMKLYIPPEANQGVNVPVADFVNYHDSFLPFDKAYLTINH
ncbi:MAG TPA: hypothetical protein PLX10_00735 [Candidatus Paceibacterota bacterium]|nr:hypothetical protein [Candidatus Paceibacterota bacterium]